MMDNPFAVLDRRLNHLEDLIRDLSKMVGKQRELVIENECGPEKPITANELARILETTVENIHRQKKKENIPYRRIGGRVYFLLSEVLEAMQKGGQDG